MENEKNQFFDRWKDDWEERKEEFETNQAELFRRIRDRRNLEMRLERRMEELSKKIAEGISKEVYPIESGAKTR